MTERRPLAIDLFTGLHGWAEGLIAAGFYVVGVDIVDMSGDLGEPKPEHFSLIVQDVLTLHGSQFRDAELIVASPPCQAFSYMAMPWSRAKEKAAAIRADASGEMLADLTRLFDACFRIQREASEAAGRHIPMVVENVKGAQPWVGRARSSFGSYFLWGDVPALMPIQKYHQRLKVSAGEQWNVNRPNYTGSIGWDAGPKNRHVANIGGPQHEDSGIKQGGSWFHDNKSASRMHSSKSPRRKAASAKIAKIPFPLARWIGNAWLSRAVAA